MDKVGDWGGQGGKREEREDRRRRGHDRARRENMEL